MHVPEMSAKIALLMRYGRIRRKADLAERIGVSVSTFNGWINGSNKSAAEWVPPNRWATFVAEIVRSLPGESAAADAEQLLLGKTGDLERALRPEVSAVLGELLSSEGQYDTAQLQPCPGLGLVEIVREAAPNRPSVAIDEPFMVLVNAKRGGYALALDNAGSLWGVVEFAEGGPSQKVAAGQILIPGIKNYRFICMRESTGEGPHRIVLFLAPEPFPAAILDAHRNRVTLDNALLNQLAAHMAAQPKHLREIHVLDFDVRKS